MKTAIFTQYGFENLKMMNIPIPEVKDNMYY